MDLSSDQEVLGSLAVIKFPSLGGKEVRGKVDTGATTSSLHAVNISVLKNNTVSFKCPQLTNNTIVMDLCGSQEVTSADAGGIPRPVVKFNIEIGDVVLKDVVFNLNDRSEMEDPILIGQNIISAGNFLIDINKDESSDPDNEPEPVDIKLENIRDNKILEAIGVLIENDITLDEFLKFIKTMAVNQIKD